MVVIWYAIGLYILGIAVVLYMRPAIMFQPGGVWKEFGISKSDDYSVLPFWLFTVVWAVFSYALATLISILLASVVLRSATEGDVGNSAVSGNIFMKPISSVNTETSFPASNVFASSGSVQTPRLPGYYVLESAAATAAAQPRYVYWGPEPPRFA